MAEPVEIEMVTLRYPCTACHILAGLQDDVLRAVQKAVPVTVKRTVLSAPAHAREVAGLEVERFPALIAGGEQITCGDLLGRRELLAYLRSIEGR